MVLRKIPDDARVIKQRAEISLGQRQVQNVLAVVLLDQPILALETSRRLVAEQACYCPDFSRTPWRQWRNRET